MSQNRTIFCDKHEVWQNQNSDLLCSKIKLNLPTMLKSKYPLCACCYSIVYGYLEVDHRYVLAFNVQLVNMVKKG